MRYLGTHKYPFPEHGNKAEVDAWAPVVHRRALARNVLAVARTRIEGAWGAYIDAVSGVNHDDEQGAVLDHGTKLLPEIARVLFWQFENIPYAR